VSILYAYWPIMMAMRMPAVAMAHGMQMRALSASLS